MKITEQDKRDNSSMFFREIECIKINEEYIPLWKLNIIKETDKYNTEEYLFLYEYKGKKFDKYSVKIEKIMWDYHLNKPKQLEIIAIKDPPFFNIGEKYLIQDGNYSAKSKKLATLTKVEYILKSRTIITYADAMSAKYPIQAKAKEYLLERYNPEYYFDDKKIADYEIFKLKE